MKRLTQHTYLTILVLGSIGNLAARFLNGWSVLVFLVSLTAKITECMNDHTTGHFLIFSSPVPEVNAVKKQSSFFTNEASSFLRAT